MTATDPIAPDAELELAGSIARGDDDAFERLVRHFGARMLAVARRLLGNDGDAQDALQDAFLAAFRSIGRFEGKARLSTWLHRIVVNAALMKLRAKRRRPECDIDALQPQFLEDGHHVDAPQPWRAMPQEEVLRNELRDRVRDAIDALPDTYRTVLLLRDIAQLDTAETARRLDITPNAVKIRLHRARLALRTLLDPDLREAAA